MLSKTSIFDTKAPSEKSTKQDDDCYSKTIIDIEETAKLPVANIVISNEGEIDPLGDDDDVLVVTAPQGVPHAILYDECSNDDSSEQISSLWWTLPVHKKLPCLSRRCALALILVISLPVISVASFLFGRHKVGKDEFTADSNADGENPQKQTQQHEESSKGSSSAHFHLWQKVGQDIDGVHEDHFFGADTSLNSNGNILAVGSRRGVFVYQFQSDSNSWKQLGETIPHCSPVRKLRNKTSQNNHYNIRRTMSECDDRDQRIPSGVVLSADGSRILYGGNFGSFGFAATYEYIPEESTWRQLGDTLLSDSPTDGFGKLFDFSNGGDRVAVLASIGLYVNIYDLVPAKATTTNDNDHTAESFMWHLTGVIPWKSFRTINGKILSLSGNGRRLALSNSNSKGVSVYEVDEITQTWNKLPNDIRPVGDIMVQLGHAVDLSEDGNRIAVAAPLDDSFGFYAGTVEVYEFNSLGKKWMQMGHDIFSKNRTELETTNQQFGYSLSLSAGGTRIAVGSIGKSRSHVYEDVNTYIQMFDFFDNEWHQVGGDIEAEAQSDWLGHSVALSSNGKRVAAGAPMNDGEHNEDSGHVRVYEFCPETQL